MKTKLMYSLIAGIVLAVVYSFTLIKPVAKKAPAKVVATEQFACSAAVTSIASKSYNYAANTVTITFNASGYSYLTCGGNYFCATGTSFFLNNQSATITIPLGPGGCGGNARVIPICSNGQEGTSLLFTF